MRLYAVLRPSLHAALPTPAIRERWLYRAVELSACMTRGVECVECKGLFSWHVCSASAEYTNENTEESIEREGRSHLGSNVHGRARKDTHQPGSLERRRKKQDEMRKTRLHYCPAPVQCLLRH